MAGSGAPLYPTSAAREAAALVAETHLATWGDATSGRRGERRDRIRVVDVVPG